MNQGTRNHVMDRQPRAYGMCASCGKRPPLEGFAMCAPCRVKLELPVDAVGLKQAQAVLAKERADRDAANARFNARNQAKTAARAAESETHMTENKCDQCERTFTNEQGLKVHKARAHGVLGKSAPGYKQQQEARTPSVADHLPDEHTQAVLDAAVEPVEAVEVIDDVPVDAYPETLDAPCDVLKAMTHDEHAESHHRASDVELNVRIVPTSPYRDRLITKLSHDARSVLPWVARRAIAELSELAREA